MGKWLLGLSLGEWQLLSECQLPQGSVTKETNSHAHESTLSISFSSSSFESEQGLVE